MCKLGQGVDDSIKTPGMFLILFFAGFDHFEILDAFFNFRILFLTFFIDIEMKL